MYVISEVVKQLAGYSTTLSIYNGENWLYKFIKYGDEIITDIEVYKNELWVSTFSEIYKVN